MQEAELRQLQYQIDPHFLYNSFFLLSSFAEEEDYDALRSLSQLMGSYFKFITRSNQSVIPLREEARHASIYAQIQEMRFSPRIKVEAGEPPERLRGMRVQRLIIQPLLENAFLHGVRHIQAGGIVRLSYIDEGKRLIIRVEDNGEGISDEQIHALNVRLQQNEHHTESVALNNIAQRLRISQSGGCLQVRRSELGGLLAEIVLRVEGGR